MLLAGLGYCLGGEFNVMCKREIQISVLCHWMDSGTIHGETGFSYPSLVR